MLKSSVLFFSFFFFVDSTNEAINFSNNIILKKEKFDSLRANIFKFCVDMINIETQGVYVKVKFLLRHKCELFCKVDNKVGMLEFHVT